MKTRRIFWPIAGLFVCSAHVYAATTDQILKQPNLSLVLANQLISATLKACHADNRSAVVAVVDRGGNLIAMQRDDQVGPHNSEAAQRKAFTALSTKTPTRLLAERARTMPDSQNLATLETLLLIGGGVPIFSGKEIIGAIGVGGAGGAAQDENCALQAIQQVLPTTN